MTASIPAAELIAANPGPAAHLALLGVVVVIALIVYAIVRIRRKREAAEAQKLDQSEEIGQRQSGQRERVRSRSGHHGPGHH